MSISTVKKHVMTGISYMIPMVVAGGILGALAKGLGGWQVGDYAPDATDAATIFSNLNMLDWKQFWWSISKLSDFAMAFACGVLAAGIAYSMSERPGIVPGFIIGYTANQAKAGFLGAMIMAFFIGWLVNVFKKIKLPKAMMGLMPVLIIPVCVTFISGVVFFGVAMAPMTWIMNLLLDWITSLNSGSQFIVGAVIGACMGFDMGGPINKTASMAANALMTDEIYAPESAKIIGGMTPPLGVAISTFLQPKKFTQAERDTGISCIFMGLCFITEGVLPFAANDPVRFIPCSMIGSGIAGGLAMMLAIETPAAHGGIFVMPLSTNPLMWVVALVVGSVVTGVLYAIVKKPLAEEDTVEEEIVDLDINL